jgi:hypothetical protein
MRIVVTDLTRFNNEELLCLAGLTEDGKQCIRPMRPSKPGYVAYAKCKELNVLPGTILEGDFTMPQHVEPPHVETRNFTKLKVKGQVTSDEFKAILEISSSTSIRGGLGITQAIDKVLTIAPARSIMTLRIPPKAFQVVLDDYNKVRAHLIDGDGVSLRYLSISDLGFFLNVGSKDNRKVSPDEITKFIRSQDELLIRLGLSQKHTNQQGRTGYWLQVNGIYTFPEYDHIVRAY